MFTGPDGRPAGAGAPTPLVPVAAAIGSKADAARFGLAAVAPADAQDDATMLPGAASRPATRLTPATPAPLLLAVGQMLAEAQQREATALTRAIAAEQRIAVLEAEIKTLQDRTPPTVGQTPAPAP